MEQITLTLSSPITEEQWDRIADWDFENTDSVTFHTKHGEEVEFVKRKTQKWKRVPFKGRSTWECPECGYRVNLEDGGMYYFCSACGTKMGGT